MSGARAVVCDFGGVLTTPLEHAFAAFAGERGLPLEALGEVMAAQANRAGVHPLHELETGRVSEGEFLAALGTEVGERLGRPVDMSGFAEAWFGHLDVNRALLERLAAWRAAGVRLALCTNNVREWEPRWRAMLPPVDELFEAVVDSAFVGVRKPDPRIYAIVLERLGDVPAEACVFLDDLEVNCEAARAAGMRAVRFVENATAIPAVEAALAAAT